MEIGADAVLINTAIATATTPARWRSPSSWLSRRDEKPIAPARVQRRAAEASSPLTGFLREEK